MKKYIRPISAILSALFLFLSFPPASEGDMIWVALVPIILLLRTLTPKEGFKYGYLCGLCFWPFNLGWLMRLVDNGGPWWLVVIGLVFLGAYLSLFFGLFGACVASVWSILRQKNRPILRTLTILLVEPLLFVGCEYLRANLLTGFPWNPLAAALYKSPALLHITQLGGSYALSLLICMFNSSLAAFVWRIYEEVIKSRFTKEFTPQKYRFRSLELSITVLILALSISSGINAARKENRRPLTFRAAIIHPSQPCVFENSEEAEENVRDTLTGLTKAATLLNPDLVIWPETCIPGLYPYEGTSKEYILESESTAPILTGILELERHKNVKREDINKILSYDLYNSAITFTPNATPISIYRKQHLVPFGEYVPGESIIPALKKWSPAGFSCEAGTNSAVFALGVAKIGSLICFEDAFPQIARNAVRDGASLLVTVASDAWFWGSYEAEQHLAQAVLRSAELSRPQLRATNRGISAAISATGRVLDSEGTGYFCDESGFTTCAVAPSEIQTPYAKYGDITLGVPAAIITILTLISALIWNKQCHSSVSKTQA